MVSRLLIAHSGLSRGENHGVFIQHVESMRWLFENDPRWEVVSLDLLHPSFADAALAADVLVLSMCGAPEIETLIRLRRERGLRTIFEITDNVLAPVEWLPPGHPFRSPLGRQHILFHASRCDALQVYAPALAELFLPVNPNVTVFDPYVPFGDELPAKPAGFVFGWGGTKTHEGDLRAIVPAVESFCARHPDATFAFMGDRELFDSLFGALPPQQRVFRPFGQFDDYLDFIRGLHAGIAPLRVTPFNATRTDTKFVSYAAGGAAALLEDSALHRPHAGHALLFRTTEELERGLESLYANRGAMRELAARAWEWLRAFRNRDALHAQREQFYRRFLPAGSGTQPVIEDDGGAAEQLLAAACHEETIDVCRALLARRPAYAKAQWHLAASLDATGRHAEALAFAESVAPHPLYADLFAELRARRDPKHTAEVVSPYRRLRLEQRNADDPLAYYRAVLREQPYDFFALAAVIRLVARTAPDAPELDALYARATLVAPESVPPHRRPRGLDAYLPP